MDARIFEINARKKPIPILIADPTDFELIEKATVSPQLVITSPLISLYCLDHANQQALFVETPPNVDLSQAPFYYVAQYETATRVIAIPYELLHQLASQINFDDHRLVLVYSVGRSGSTLLEAALNAVDNVVGFSEPDVFSQLVALRAWDGSNAAEISALTESCMKLVCKPTGQISHPDAWVIKFRSFCIEIGDLLYQYFPHSRNIMLYRNAESYLNSAMRAFVDNEHDVEVRKQVQGILRLLVPSIDSHIKNNGPLLTQSAMVSMGWVRTLECYMDLLAKGMPGLAIRYEDIKAAPQDTVKQVFAYCGFPAVDMEKIDQVMAKDSQTGSFLSRELVQKRDFVFSEMHRAELEQILQAHPVIKSPNYIVPSTWIREQV